ncbi:protein outspread-like [Tigriopus californicus]|nr:protein outspread-like [Tigriopus californicus]
MGLGECRKFVPNIFNKQKCSNCYKLKLQHSEEALEVAKTARNVARCGYLFVAPDWDFTNPVYRTKRWQRRWFVLFDDGELTYSIDDHPETVPFCVIDMNNVFEITSADGITGN